MYGSKKFQPVFLGALLLALSSCTQKLGVNLMGGDSNIAPRLRPVKIADAGITFGAKLTAQDGYVWATGGGDGFGAYSMSSWLFTSGKSAVDPTQGGFNIFGTDVTTITALVKAGDYVFISGSKGLAQLDVSDITHPEVYRLYPDPQRPEMRADLFKWSSAVHVPGTQRVYGFRGRNIYNLAFDADQPSVSQMSYDIGCGEGAAFFNNKIYVAGCTQLLKLSPQSGEFNVTVASQLNAVDVFATQRFLYVQHQPVNGYSSANQPAGIYIFDGTGKFIKWLNITPISFAVSSDDRFIFSNDYDEDIAIYAIPWTTSSVANQQVLK